jgi:NAD-dependent SIR2 family protein deacetylase
MVVAENQVLFENAAALIDQADGLLITAGAGMGVDSGLLDFRGAEGFWNPARPTSVWPWARSKACKG